VAWLVTAVAEPCTTVASVLRCIFIAFISARAPANAAPDDEQSRVVLIAMVMSTGISFMIRITFRIL